jgi:hypothetical protein
VRETMPGEPLVLSVAELLPAAAIEVAEISTIDGPATEAVQTREDTGRYTLHGDTVVASEIDLPVVERITAFIEYARSQARPRWADTQENLAAYSEFESRLTFAEWAKSFIRAAQVRARLGIASQMAGKLASR